MNIYFNPVHIYQGYGSLERLKDISMPVLEPGKKILLLVWNEDVLKYSGINSVREADGCSVVVKQFKYSNPELEQLWQIYNDVKGLNIGLVIAVGGGSVLDVGKSLCCLLDKSLNTAEDLKQMIENKAYGKPVCRWIGVPTTAGTGSEVTCWATVWNSADNVKYSVDTSDNYAYAAVIDPQLAETMPCSLAVSSALDAAAHAAESYWARASNTVSKALALNAVRTIMENIDGLIQSSGSQGHDCMAKGSMLAGLAFSNTRTTACHSISYPLTMKYHIPHGIAVSLLLGPVFELNFSAVKDADKLLSAFGINKPEDLGEKICSILNSAGISCSLREWGVEENALCQLAAAGITKGRADNNPVELTKEVVYNILKKVF